MLTARAERILNCIIEQFVTRAVPVSSQSIVRGTELGVSSATVRNEVAYLKEQGYITHPHHSAGSIPTDKGYRYYVQTMKRVELPFDERCQISHLFHQVESLPEEWLRLSAALLARLTQNVAVVSMPRTAGCLFKHLEIINLRDSLVLLVFVLHGARIKDQLLNFEEPVSQARLTAIAARLNAEYSGLSSTQIAARKTELSAIEKTLIDSLVKLMQAEDEARYEESHLDGWHFMLNQPEFAQTRRLLALMELAEQRNLLRTVVPQSLHKKGVQVVIGRENKSEAVHECSVVISRYGIHDGPFGTIGVVGPTRMAYGRNVSIVDYLASVLDRLMAELYGEGLRRTGETS